MTEDPGFPSTRPAPGGLRPPRAAPRPAMAEDAGSRPTGPAPGTGRRLHAIRAGVVIAVAVLIGIGVWLAFRGGSSSSSSPVPTGSKPVLISVQGLRTVSSAWASRSLGGEKSGFS